MRSIPCAGGIEAIRQDFFAYEPKQEFDIVCCFQVLEHIQDVESFCQKLLRLSRNLVIVSVPYMWEKGWCKSHVQDPINYDKLVSWFGYEPAFCNIVDEHFLSVSVNAELGFECLDRQRKTILWGNGDCLARNLSRMFEQCDIKYVCDNDPDKWGDGVGGLDIKCIPPQALVGLKNIYVIIMIDDEAVAIQVANQLLSMGIREFDHIDNWLRYAKKKL